MASDATLPEGVVASRASVSCNFLFTIGVPFGGPDHLLLTNFDPGVYNTWFPPFHFFPWVLPAGAKTYRDLQTVVTQGRPPEARSDQAKLSATSVVKDRLSLSLLDSKKVAGIPDEVWLKFSRSQQQWTVYQFEYYVITEIDRRGLERLHNKSEVAFLPLQGKLFENALETGKFQTIPIVDNILRLLNDRATVAELKNRARELVLHS
jgi:hypothetical protein